MYANRDFTEVVHTLQGDNDLACVELPEAAKTAQSLIFDGRQFLDDCNILLYSSQGCPETSFLSEGEGYVTRTFGSGTVLGYRVSCPF